jgi:hypothetical protein
MIYAWQPWFDRWVGLAQGALKTKAQGGLFMEAAGTNLIPNSDFENEADTDNSWTAEAGLTPSENSDPDLVYNGYFSIKLVCGAAAKTFTVTYTAANTNTHALSCYARGLDGRALTSSDCQLHYAGNDLTTTFTADADRPGWYRLTATAAGVASPQVLGIKVKASKTVVVDSFQFEENNYSTPLMYGNLGRGYSFSGASHTTSSVRAAAGICFRNAVGTVGWTLPQDKATVLVVWKAPRAYDGFSADPYYFYSGSMRAYYDISPTRQWTLVDGTNTLTLGATSFAADDVLFLLFRYGPSGLAIRVYNSSGVLVASTSSATYTPPAVNAALWIGSDSTPAGQCGEVQECQIWHEELTAAECESRAKAGRGEGQLPYLWSSAGTGAILNHDDTGANHDNWIELGNAPGDFDAGLKLFVQNTAAITPLFLYVGQMRRGVPRTDLPSKRYLVGNHADVWLEVEDGSASYPATVATIVDAAASAGNKARYTPVATSEVKCVNVPVCNEPEDLWKYVGRWRCVILAYTASADNFQVRLRAVTGAYSADYTAQVYADANSVWRPVTPTDQWLDIPAFAIEPALAQEFRPGDWASGADGVYAYIELYAQAVAAAGSIDFDAVLLLPQDNEGMVTLAATADWPQNRHVMLDSIGDVSMCVVHDNDLERLKSGGLYEGTRFTLPVREPCRMIFMWRRSGTGYPWTIADTCTITAKCRPRYQKVC